MVTNLCTNTSSGGGGDDNEDGNSGLCGRSIASILIGVITGFLFML